MVEQNKVLKEFDLQNNASLCNIEEAQQNDNPRCVDCGGMTIQTGRCFTCQNCGSSSSSCG